MEGLNLINSRVFEPGFVIAEASGRAVAKTEVEWNQDVAKVWDAQLAELQTHEGFVGAIAFWKQDDSGIGLIFGFWDGIEHRLAYEKRSANARAIVSGLWHGTPTRARYTISAATFKPRTTSG